MAAGWIHQAHDLIVFGRTYADVHRVKDAASQRTPGHRHRATGHEWYQRFGRDWDFGQPFPNVVVQVIQNIKACFGPDAAEERMSSDAHDFLDRVWDELPMEERLYREGFFVWLIYRPEILESCGGVDVIRGRIQRTIDGRTLWEDSPETVTEYKCLRREVSRHHKWRLGSFLARFG